MSYFKFIAAVSLSVLSLCSLAVAQTTYTIVDTGQTKHFNNTTTMGSAPTSGQAFFGQDANYSGNQPDYTDNGVTITDNNTGLTWVKTPVTNADGTFDSGDKLGWTAAQAHPATLNAASFGTHDDWRLPTIKELYSLIDFSGIDPPFDYPGDTAELTPFINTTYFDFVYGDPGVGERIIDAQYRSSTEYVSTTMNGDHTVFGVNFADGRIKGYGTSYPQGQGGEEKTQFVRCVRGNPNYGENNFEDNGDGTITDNATGLMWQKADDGVGKDWQAALAYAESLPLAGHDDWRLPNAKELQSIIDYTRAPDSPGSPAAIDPLFVLTNYTAEDLDPDDYGHYWTGTTHESQVGQVGHSGVYIAFGEAMGYMTPPSGPPGTWMDVHGAGAQRSDPKDGNPGNYPTGRGPQGDAVRINNFVLAVRTVPEPSAFALATVGLLSLGFYTWRRRRRA